MDTSPTVPCKRLQLGYASPFSLSPCVSPLMGNSPLHHSFSRKSSTTQELTPLPSPSSGIANPFALKYDTGGTSDHWQSFSGSGSASSSPSIGNTPTNHSRTASISMDEMGPTTKILNAQKYSNGMLEEHRNFVSMETLDGISDTPTPLSPKGLQFRQKPFPLSVKTLPSPIPRQALNGTLNSSFNHTVSGSSSGWISPRRIQPSSPAVIVDQSNIEITSNRPHHSLQHDKHLSPFNSDVYASSHPPRKIKKLKKSAISSSRQMIRPEPQRPPSIGMDTYIGRSTNPSSSNRLSISSPLTKLRMSSSLESDHLQGGRLTSSTSSGSRTPVKRRMSDISTDSQDDGFMMESDESSVGGSFEESMPTTKTLRTIS